MDGKIVIEGVLTRELLLCVNGVPLYSIIERNGMTPIDITNISPLDYGHIMSYGCVRITIDRIEDVT